MPTRLKDVTMFFERFAALQTKVDTLRAQVDNLMLWQKWQMGILAVILAAVLLRHL